MRFTSVVAAALCSVGAFVSALDPIEAVGNKFFNQDGSQFFIKGVAYQLRPADPLIDTEQCTRDASLMNTLGVNAIRVYHVDPASNHDGCMSTFAENGIYVLADLDTFDTYILPHNLSWTQGQYDRYGEVMDAFHQYDNILGFFIGNENIAKKEDSKAAPFLKAATRDMKAYRDRKGYRNIPIGYSAADIKQLRPMLQDYLTCGGKPSESVDFFSLNSYSWCDPSDYHTSSYDQLQEYAANFPVPIFFSETGCNTPGPRKFDDQDAIFGQDMVKDWSGSIIYEWIQEENNYGIITYGPAGDAAPSDVEGGFARKGTPKPFNSDFDTLKSKWASLNPTGVKKGDYDAGSVSTRDCPKATPGGWWEVDGDVPLPTLGDSLLATITAAPTTRKSGTKGSPTTTKLSSKSKSKSGAPGTTALGSDKDQSHKSGSAPAFYPATFLSVSFIAGAISFAFLI